MDDQELQLTAKKEGRALSIALSGEVNTATAPQLKNILDAELPESDEVTFDFQHCDFVSSAGLRILLATFKTLRARKGKMKLTNIGPNFREVLNITGLDTVFGCKQR